MAFKISDGSSVLYPLSFVVVLAFSLTFSTNTFAQCTLYTVGGGGAYCSGGSGVAITLSGSQSGISYQLKRGTTNVGSTIAGTGSALTWPLQTTAGTYTVKATGSCTLQMNGSAVVTVNSAPNQYTVSGGGTICGSQVRSVQLSNSQTGANYQLIKDGVNTGSPIAGTGAALTWSNLNTAGVYTVRGTNATTGCFATMSSSATITVNTPASYTITGSGNFCASATVTLSGSTVGVDYKLKRDGITAATSVPGTGSALAWTVSSAGTYTIEITNPSSNCTITNPGNAVITIETVPNVLTVSGGGTICGTEVRSIQLNVSQTGFHYQLKRDGSNVGSAVTSTGESLTWPNLADGGTYTVEATNSNSLCSTVMNGSPIITVNTPASYTIGGSGTFCGTTTVTLSGSETGVSYQLKRNGTSSGSDVSGTGSGLTWTVSATGTYTIEATRTAVNCTITNPGSVAVTINPAPVAYNVNGGGVVCDSDVQQVSLSDSETGASYQLVLNGANFGAPIAGTGVGLTWPNLSAGGTYTVNAIIPSTGCAATMDGTATIINNSAAVFTVGGSGTFCCGLGKVTVSGSEVGVTYELRRDGFPIQNGISGTGAPLSWSGIDDTGNYTVRATKAGTTCHIVFPTSASITILPSPEQKAVVGGGAVCEGDTEYVKLITTQPNVSYQLRLNGQNIQGPKPGGAPVEWTSLTQVGYYSVMATSTLNGCTTLMEDSVQMISDVPQIFNVSGGGGLCTNPTITLSSSETGVLYSLVRDGNSGGLTLTGTGAALIWTNLPGGGTYSVRARKDYTTCTIMMNGTASVYGGEIFPVEDGGIICIEGGTVDVTLEDSETSGKYQLKKDGVNYGAPVSGTGSVLTWPVANAGVYTVVGTDDNGNCPATMGSSATVTSDIIQTFTISGGGTICDGQSTVITLSSQNTVKYQLLRNGILYGSDKNGTGSIISLTASMAGDYTVRATHIFGGCTKMMNGTATIAVAPSPTKFAITGGAALCEGSSGTITLSGSETGVDYRLKYGSTLSSPVSGAGEAISWSGLTTPATYRVEGTLLSNGCTRLMGPGQVVSFHAYPVASTVSGGGSICDGTESATVTLATTQTDVFYSLLKNTESTGIDVPGTGSAYSWTVTSGGTYTVIGKNKYAGCATTMNSSATVTVKASPEVFIVSGGGIVESGGPTSFPVTLSDSETGVTYQLLINEVNSGSAVSGTGSALTWASQSTFGNYTVNATRTSSSCVKPMLGSGTIDSDSYAVPDPALMATRNYIKVEESYVPLTDATIASAKIQEKAISFQYFDGLGRPVQTVDVKGSPTRGDVILHQEYDQFGREAKKYLPYTNFPADGVYNTNAGAEQTAFYAENSTYNQRIKTSAYAYAETIFEPSPMNRPSQVGSPGLEWQPNTSNPDLAKTIKLQYLTNADGLDDGEETITKWTVQTVTLNSKTEYIISAGGSYASGSLYVKVSKDEENRQVREYTDKLGNVVLKKVQYVSSDPVLAAEAHWTLTYYIYDDLNRLRFVLQPKFIHRYSSYTALSGNQPKKNMLDSLTFEYRYDDRGRMIYKRVPGANCVEMVYDQWDRLVLSQDGNQRVSGKWSFIKYDIYNRPLITGEFASGNTQPQMITAVSAITNRFETTSSGNDIGYTTNLTYPASVSTSDIFTVSYYDDYSFLTNLGLGTAYHPVIPSGFTGIVNYRVKGKPTGSKVRVLDSSPAQWLVSATYYDEYYRPVHLVSDDLLGNKNSVTNEYFGRTGRITKTFFQHGTSVSSLSEIEYDHRGSVIKQWQTMDGGTKVLIELNKYNEIGQVVEKNIHSTDNGLTFLQSNDYRYNIRGWPTHINNGALTNDGSVNDDSNDLFGMELKYNTSVMVNGVATTAQYNGNISSMQWKTNNLKDTPTEKMYGFTYDALNRLGEARYSIKNGSTWSGDANVFNEALTYDKNGNITTLVRKSLIGGLSVSAGGTATNIDNLTYKYKGNTLDVVNDMASANVKPIGFSEAVVLTAGEYEYDANGNMNVDLNKGLVGPTTGDSKGVLYNHLNLPKEVRLGSKKIVYTYDATGQKLKKVAYNESGTAISQTIYVGGIQYEGTTPELKFVSTGEGRIVKNGSTWDYEYFHKDHLGNTRVVYGYQKQVDEYKATMESALSTSEESTFKNVSQTRSISTFNHTPSSYHTLTPDKVCELNGALTISGTSTPRSVGLAKVLQVSSGDRVQLEVFARYQYGVGSNNNVITSIASAVTGAFGLGTSEAPYTTLNNNLPTLAGGITRNGTASKAYLFYILLDANYAYYGQFGYSLITPDAAAGFERLYLDVNVPQGGFIYTYVANESNVYTTSSVYFDDFSIVHIRNTNALQVVQTMDYYPFGLAINATAYQKQTSIDNNHLYNGKELQDEYALGWIDYGARMYMSDIARWGVVDPLSSIEPSWSPYRFCFNNPINLIDPDGMLETDGNGNFRYTDPTEIRNVIAGLQLRYGKNLGAGQEGGDEPPEEDEKNPRQKAMKLFKDKTQVLPVMDGQDTGWGRVKNLFSHRNISIDGEEFEVDANGYLDYDQFEIKLSFDLPIGPAGPMKLFNFASRSKAFIHYAKHVKNLEYIWKTRSWKAITSAGSLAGEIKGLNQYITSAQRFFSSTKNIISFTSKTGTMFKYNTQTGHFGVVNAKGVIETYYKLDPAKGLSYFVKQIATYGSL
jgi:RHS repeat-associated protein